MSETARITAGAAALLALVGMGAWSLREPAPAAPAPAAPPSTSGVLPGLCEASALLADGDGFLVGDNEGETELFRFGPKLSPQGTLPLAHPVEDVEALARLPDGAVLVVASQGRNKKGERKAMREQVLVVGAEPVTPDLGGCAPCVEAADLPPKEGGLSVEGAAWWNDALWLGLRSPLVEGKALLLRMEGDPRTALAVAEVRAVDLGGEGVRDLTVHDGELWILAGPADREERPHSLYVLADALRLLADDLPLHSEGLVVDIDLLLVTDGDGEPGSDCKAPARWERRPLP